ncbi:MAG: ATP-binding cassette domain-containing protein, partial [Clostridia bacterium]|nr:ATP-binding cassette domain-containing protein [Clostridia bacterium]
DAYRNTFVGFIFQEYNILDDFTVGANIGLALELQGKKADSAKISEILAEVDLLDYAKRKPNELSGGQKQRIAIARALVKDPEIIMADEPTGALDSGTGKQIFDTLKALSRKKLVIVVSHDRDFAERYADRIIEMKDGQIFSDVTRHEVEAEAISDGILQINEHLLRIERGYQLTANDVERINAYLRTHDTELLVSGDPRLNSSVRATAGISENNTSAVFETTDEQKDVRRREYHAKDTRFIRSRLPMKNAVKMGGSSLGHKKFRLVVTILLSVIAFTMFGFADTMGAYNKHKAATQSILDSHVGNASFTLGVKQTYSSPDGSSSHYYSSAPLNDDDIAFLKDKLNMDFIPVYNGSSYAGDTINLSHLMQTSEFTEGAYTGKLYGMVAPTADQIRELGFEVTGTLPTAEDEIAITRLVYEQFKTNGFDNRESKESIDGDKLTMSTDKNDPNSIIGKHLTLSFRGWDASYRITAVIDTKFDYERYADFLPQENGAGLPEDDSSAIIDFVMQEELISTLNYGFHALGFLAPSGIDALAESIPLYQEIFLGTSMQWQCSIQYSNEGENYTVLWLNCVADSSVLPDFEITWLDGKPRTQLGENEAVVSSNLLQHLNLHTDLRETMVGLVKASADASLWRAEYEDQDPYYALWQLAVEESIDKHFESRKGDVKSFLGADEEIDDASLRQMWFDWYDEIASALSLPSQREVFAKKAAHILSTLLKTEVSDTYSESFYSNLISRLSGEISTHELAHVLASNYAHKEIYTKGEALYGSEEFYNTVLKNYIGDKDSWESYGEEHRREIAADAYADYVLYCAEKNLFGDVNASDLNEAASTRFFELADLQLDDIFSDFTISSMSYWDDTEETYKNLKIVGLYSGEGAEDLIISDTFAAIYEEFRVAQNLPKQESHPHALGRYAFVIAPMPDDPDAIEALVALSYDESEGLNFSMQNQVMNSLDFFNEFIEIGAQVFLWIGVGFAVFSALMLMNFISVSISYKRREIGILRAVGARSSDVFKIFFSEAFIIAGINCLLSIAATITTVSVLNSFVRKEGINVTLLNFGARQVILMLFISLFVAALASFLPVWKIARKKPVDAIKNK